MVSVADAQEPKGPDLLGARTGLVSPSAPAVQAALDGQRRFTIVLAPAGAVADTVVVMANGRSAATGTPRGVLTPDRLSEGVDASPDERGALHVCRLER